MLTRTSPYCCNNNTIQ